MFRPVVSLQSGRMVSWEVFVLVKIMHADLKPNDNDITMVMILLPFARSSIIAPQ